MADHASRAMALCDIMFSVFYAKVCKEQRKLLSDFTNRTLDRLWKWNTATLCDITKSYFTWKAEVKKHLSKRCGGFLRLPRLPHMLNTKTWDQFFLIQFCFFLPTAYLKKKKSRIVRGGSSRWSIKPLIKIKLPRAIFTAGADVGRN